MSRNVMYKIRFTADVVRFWSTVRGPLQSNALIEEVINGVANVLCGGMQSANVGCGKNVG